MMSIESAGKCDALGKMNREKKEESGGLFQIDSTQHQCLNNKKGSLKNSQCLKNPINNLNEGIGILVKHYGDVNPNGLKPLCKDWLKKDSKERDSWRRAVSAYNGGPGWITRALYAAKNVDKTLKNTGYLQFTHTFETGRQCQKIKACIRKQTSACKKMKRKYGNIPLQQVFQNCKGILSFKNDKKNPVSWEVNWELLRSYYFLERLSPGNKSGSGRQMKWIESNLAHTEAILGREIKNEKISHGMVEIWAQYKRKNSVSCP